jgi:hypothetical protein
MEAGHGVYLAPLRLLALENYEWMNSEGAPCNLLTGEEEILVEDAQITSCTMEKLNLSKRYRVAVEDEAQLLADSWGRPEVTESFQDGRPEHLALVYNHRADRGPRLATFTRHAALMREAHTVIVTGERPPLTTWVLLRRARALRPHPR